MSMPAARWPRTITLLGLVLAWPRPASAEPVWVLDLDRAAAEARVEAVVRAGREVLASSFIVGADPLSLTGLALLRDAARRGVEVRLLVDAQWNGIPRPVLAHLVAEGVEIREYHPFRWRRLSWTLRRMHDKLLIVDGETVIAGGRNVASAYFGLGRQAKARNYLDTDLQAGGEAAREARTYFLALWESRHVSPAGAASPAVAVERARSELDRHWAWLEERIAAARADPERRTPQPLEVARVRFVHDPVGRKEARSGVAPSLMALFDAARSEVLIESPYLVPSRSFRGALHRARRRGVRVRILTNSLASTDNAWAQAGYVGWRKWFVRHGMELWETRGPECLHSKVAVFDRQTAVVGSFNIDPRSESLNSEVALVVEDEAFARSFAESLDRHLDGAWRIEASGRPAGSRTAYPGASRGMILKLHLLRLLAPLIKPQLDDRIPARRGFHGPRPPSPGTPQLAVRPGVGAE